MPGAIPPTNYLLTEYSTVIGSFPSLRSIAKYFGVYLDENGQIRFGNGEYASKTYKGFTEEEAILDWAARHMRNELPSGYRIYRYLKDL